MKKKLCSTLCRRGQRGFIAGVAMLICVVFVCGVAGCNMNASVQVDPAEYETLYDKYIASVDVGMIFNTTWDDPNEVDANYYMYYYASELLQSGRSIFGENADGYILAEELESFVLSHFDVTVEHLRSNEYYITEKNVYEFGGLGSAWYCDITGAERKGKLLTVLYDVIGARDYRIGYGTLRIEIDGENYKYLSNEFELSVQYYLKYPSAIGESEYNGVLVMDSRGLSGTSSDGVNFTYYDGRDIDNIIAYYEQEALPPLDAKGSADISRYPNGWYWSGVYRDGKPLTIDIRRRYGRDTYIIAAAFEADADIEAARVDLDAVDPNDYDELYSLYFSKPYNAGLLDWPWTDAGSIGDSDALLRYYAAALSLKDSELRFPAKEVDVFLARHFHMDATDMRSSDIYDRTTDTYYSEEGFAESRDMARIVNAKLDGGMLTIYYETFISDEEPATVMKGTLVIELSEEGFRYTSNDIQLESIRKRYGFIDLSDEFATEEEKRLMCLVGLNMMNQSWESPKEIDPDYLINFFIALSRELYSETEIKNDEWGHDEVIVSVLMPSAEVEPAIQRHFDVSSDYLRGSMFYIEEKDAYWFGGLGSLANARIIGSKVEGTLHTITYELYHDIEFTGTGILKIEMNGGNDYRYLSNEYTPIPLTPEQQELKDSFIQIGKNMTLEEKVAVALVGSRNAAISWDRPDDRPPYDLLPIYDFMVQIGEVVMPENVEYDPYWKTPLSPAADVEAVVTSFYDVEVEYLWEYGGYDPENKTYRVPLSYKPNIRLTESRRDGDLLYVCFEVYNNGYELGRSGELTATVLENGSFRYVSCVID